MSASINIEAIVEAVVARLQHRNSSADTAKTTIAIAPQAAESATGTLSIDAQVVALEQLRSGLDGIKTIQVRSSAVVTPAVLDELRSKKIALQRRPMLSATESDKKPICVIANPQLASLVQRARQLTHCETIPVGDRIDEATKAASQRIAADSTTRIVWHTTKPFAASLVSQGPGKTRAIQLSHPGQLQQAIQEASPNLLILDSATWTDAAVVRLLYQWSQVKK